MVLKDASLSPGLPPPDLKSQQINLDTGVIIDTAPINRNFGDCLEQPRAAYYPGQTVVAKYIKAPLLALQVPLTYHCNLT